MTVVLTKGQSSIYCVGLTSLYLVPLYVLPAFHRLRPAAATAAGREAAPSSNDRNDPSVIKSRLTAATISTALSLFACRKWVGLSWDEMGLTTSGAVASTFESLYLASKLFVGSFYVLWLYRVSWKDVTREWRYTPWQATRNYIVGPISEELVFRSCVVPLLIRAGYSKSQTIWLAPSYFGLAHIHHAYGVWINGGKTKQAFVQGALSSAFQFAYTTLFGAFATFVFLKDQSVFGPIAVHVFCNMMGLPPIPQAMSAFPSRKLGILGAYAVGIGWFIKSMVNLSASF